jgi:NTE family protein
MLATGLTREHLQAASVPVRPDLSELLDGVPVLSGLSEELRHTLVDRASIRILPAGEWLFRQGDAADAMFLVLSGRVEVVLEHPVSEIVRVLGRGGCVGELALLTEAPRSAGVRARRDTELLELDRDRFVELLTEEPRFARSLTREIGVQLRASRSVERPSSDAPATIALVPRIEGARFDKLHQALRLALERCGGVAELEPSDYPESYGPMLDQAERDRGRVLLPTGNPSAADDWTAFCLRQSDRIVVVAEESGADVAVPHVLHGADLLLLAAGDGAARSVSLMQTMEPRTVHVVRRGVQYDGDVARVARRLTGSSVGLVLSGGGARGFCHIGALQELLDAGLQVDRVGGCSMGAYVGAMCAIEMDPGAMRDRAHEEFVVHSVTTDYTVPLVSLLRGARATEMLHNTFGGARIECQPRDYFCVSADLISGELAEHRSGLFTDCVGASMCLPGVFRPHTFDGRLLVDGGVLNNLPVQQMLERSEGPVIAIDVTAQFRAPERPSGRFRSAPARAWAARARRFVVGGDDVVPSFMETLARSVSVGSTAAVETARLRADRVIYPETGAVAMLDFGRLDEMIGIGRRAAADALAAEPPLPGL